MRDKGVRFVNVTPTAEDLDTGGEVEWLASGPTRRGDDPGACATCSITEKL